MLTMDYAAPAIEVVGAFSTGASRCEVRKRVSEDEAGDPLEVRCGTSVRPLGRALKGVTIDQISRCRLALTVHAVHSPRLLDLSNCRGAFRMVDVGAIWTGRLTRLARIRPESIEYIAYEKLVGRGCYKLLITYAVRPRAKSTTFRDVSGKFCVEARR